MLRNLILPLFCREVKVNDEIRPLRADRRVYHGIMSFAGYA